MKKPPTPISSISIQQSQINTLLQQSQSRLLHIRNKIQLLTLQHESIRQDIDLLTMKKMHCMITLEKKEKVFQNVDIFVKEAQGSFGKLVDSVKVLLGVVKSQAGKMEEVLRRVDLGKEEEEEE